MDTRIALLGIMIEDNRSIEKVNELLHENADYIVGRMGIPYQAKKVNIISIVIDAPNDIISALSGKIGMLNGVNAKTIYSKN